jgi:carbamoyltransferase
MNIIGIQKHSHSSACLFKNGELIYFNIEERLSKKKKDSGIPIECLKEILKIEPNIDKIIITGYNDDFDEDTLISSLIEKLGFKLSNPNEVFFSFFKPHHTSHALTAFYNSNFQEALVIVTDGRGSNLTLNDGHQANETSSAYIIKYPGWPKYCQALYKKLYSEDSNNTSNSSKITVEKMKKIVGINDKTIFDIRNSFDVGTAYSIVTAFHGFDFNHDAGKLMGLQSYGKYNSQFDDFLNSENVINMNYFDKETLGINLNNYPLLRNKSYAVDFAHKVQKSMEKIQFDLIEKMLTETKAKNLILTGGVALNVIANYNFRKNLPEDINIYIEPMCGDEGNCLGIVRMYCELGGIKTKAPNHNYLNGISPSYDFQINEGEIISEVDPVEVVDLILKQNIVAIFQGKSESGPRALGNRSILFDPRNPNGKDIVNTVKNRESFRPFACSILKDEAHKWFDMAGLDESPYMMYAMQANPGVKNIIPSVVHVDNTCRIQTVKESDNKILFELLTEFNKQTGVPILFNTSFNLAGHVICETIEDALWTLRNSKIEYLYLPDIGKLVTIKNLKENDVN